jgi:cytochrome c oxidase cbb3-type subunit 3
MRRAVLLILSMIYTLSAFAQDTAQAQRTFWDDPVNHPMLPVYLLVFFILVVITLVGIVALYLIQVINVLVVESDKARALKLGVPYIPKPSLWSKLVQRLNASVPVEEEKDIELEHNYDGIKELDNHLPPWWKWLFYGTVVYAIIYIVVFHFSDTLPLQEKEYQQELAIAEEQARKLKASQPQEEIDESTLAFSNDQALIEKGKAVFNGNNCGACHRNDGGGNTIGPNLTDLYWLHGGDVKQVFHTIKNGVVEKGMPAWGKSMSPQDVRNVTFFVMSLQGTNPANEKGPQGDLFKPATVELDSTTAIIADSVKVQASL